jgi:hypothetical protein
MPVTTISNIKTLFGRSGIDIADRLTIEDIDDKAN